MLAYLFGRLRGLNSRGTNAVKVVNTSYRVNYGTGGLWKVCLSAAWMDWGKIASKLMDLDLSGEKWLLVPQLTMRLVNWKPQSHSHPCKSYFKQLLKLYQKHIKNISFQNILNISSIFSKPLLLQYLDNILLLFSTFS
jgi:hypothetical protein